MKLMECPECLGNGEVEVEYPDGFEWIECPTCGGQGDILPEDPNDGRMACDV